MREIDNPALFQDWNLKLETSAYLKKLDKNERLPSKKK